MTRHLWIDPSFGASGDMLLGCLIGQFDDDTTAGQLIEALGTLGVDGWRLRQEPVTRAGIAATRVTVESGSAPARHWRSIDDLLASSSLAKRVVDGARRTFRLLAEVEAAQHRITVDDVHFHEVGAIDAIIDIVGVWWLVDRLAVDSITVGPVGIGHGTVRAAHGVLPIPAPATAELLRGAPIRSLDAAFETCTPTGAALLRTLGSWGPIPDGRLVSCARGAGTKDPSEHPNLVTAIIIEQNRTDGPSQGPHGGDAVTEAVVLSTNLDDVTPEVLARTIDVLIAAGADDAWIEPIIMKKGRPAHQICVLSSPERAVPLRQLLASETGTLGVRSTEVTKFVRPRRTSTVTVRGSELRIKVGPDGAKAEHDDLVALSEQTGVPVRRLAAEAAAAWLAVDDDRTIV